MGNGFQHADDADRTAMLSSRRPRAQAQRRRLKPGAAAPAQTEPLNLVPAFIAWGSNCRNPKSSARPGSKLSRVPNTF